jgi:3-dehydroquinate dehydratase-2
MKTIWLIHGVNLDMLGRRSREHYGAQTLRELEEAVTAHARQRGAAVRCFQTNHEGELVEKLHELALAGAAAAQAEGGSDDQLAGVIINPGAWTHYSYAIRDALELVAAPIAEVHLSAIETREEWRRHSVIADLAMVRIAGKGVEGYLEAVDALIEAKEA